MIPLKQVINIALCWQSTCNNLFEQIGDLLSGLVRLRNTWR